MPGVTVQIRFPHLSDLPEDTVINTLHFSPVPTAAEAALIFAAIADFYNDVHGTATVDIASFISTDITRAAPVEMRMYNTSTTGNSGPPIFDDTFTLDAAGESTWLPSEVAVVNSFYSGEASNVATGRGRIYVGPLTADALAHQAAGGMFVVSDLRIALTQASIFLEDATPANPWSVRTVSGGVVTFNDVDGGFVDSAPDTQRRRGEQAVVRTSWHV